MAGSNLLLLIDDIASILDDVSVMAKIAVKKTTGVLGDDLALNADQVSGVRAERELPVVWAVAKGSFVNKSILVPLALIINWLAPWAVMPLLMIGGLYLCFEGFEKISHKFLHDSEEDDYHHHELVRALDNPAQDMVEFEKEKIKGAIRTDFILSAEIIVITLGVIINENFIHQVMTLIGVSILMTVGVYGLVAVIVKIDDVGLYFSKLQSKNLFGKLQRGLGGILLQAAPKLMKLLTVVGMVAMFLVGGSLLIHGLPGTHEILYDVTHAVNTIPVIGGLLATITPTLLDGLTGVIAGGVVLMLVNLFQKVTR